MERNRATEKGDFYYVRNTKTDDVATLPDGDGSTLEISEPEVDPPVAFGAAPRDELDSYPRRN